MKKLIVIAVIACVVTNGAQLFLWTQHDKTLVAGYEQQLAQLNATLQAYGTDVTVYTVSEAAKSGAELYVDGTTDTPKNIVPMTIPSSMDSDQYVHDPSAIDKKIAKIAIHPGTVICNDMLMDDKLTDDMRDVDLKFSAYTVGLAKDDYIDVWFTAPYGDRYLVLSKVRVREINDKIVKAYLTEAQRHIWSGACIDFWLNAANGATLTAEKYIEPGLQSEAVAYYAVPKNIDTLMRRDPNMVNSLDQLDMSDWRSSIDQLLVIFRDTEDTVDSDGSTLSEARQAYMDELNDINDSIAESQENAADAAAATSADGEGWNSESSADESAAPTENGGTTDGNEAI